MSTLDNYMALQHAKSERLYVLSRYRRAMEKAVGKPVEPFIVREMYKFGALPPIFPMPVIYDDRAMFRRFGAWFIDWSRGKLERY